MRMKVRSLCSLDRGAGERENRMKNEKIQKILVFFSFFA